MILNKRYKQFDVLCIDGEVSDSRCCYNVLHGYDICSSMYQLDPMINGNHEKYHISPTMVLWYEKFNIYC